MLKNLVDCLNDLRYGARCTLAIISIMLTSLIVVVGIRLVDPPITYLEEICRVERIYKNGAAIYSEHKCSTITKPYVR